MTLKNINYFEKYSSICNERLFMFIGLSSYQKSPKELFRVRLLNCVLAFAIFIQVNIFIDAGNYIYRCSVGFCNTCVYYCDIQQRYFVVVVLIYECKKV